MKDRLKKAGAIIGILLFTILLFLPVLSGSAAVFKDQSYEFHYQALEFVKASLAKGDFPLWCPNMSFGYPMAAYPEFSLFYPLFILIGVTLPSVAAISIIVMLHYFMMACFTYLYGRSLSMHKAGAAVAGIAFAFNGFMLERYSEIQSLGAIAFLPLILFFIEKSIAFRSWKKLVFAGLILGLSFLAGGTQYSYYVVFFLCLYTLFRFWVHDWHEKPGKRIQRGILATLLIGLIGTGIFAVQLLPTIQLSNQTARANLDISEFEEFKDAKPDHVFSASSLTGLIFPYLPDKSPIDTKPIHPGCLVLFFAFWAIIFIRKPTSIFYFLFTLATFLLAAGSLTPFFPMLYELPIPGFSMFKNPVRIVMLGVFALSILAGLGVDNLIQDGLYNRKRKVAFRLGLIAFFAVAFLAVSPWLLGQHSSTIPMIKGIMLLTLIVLVFIVGEVSRKNDFQPRWMRLAPVVLVATNLWLAAPILDFLPMEEVQQRISPTPREDFLNKQEGHFRIFSFDSEDVFGRYNTRELVENLGLSKGLELADGNSSLHLSRYLQFTHKGNPPHPRQQYAYDDWIRSPALIAMTGLEYLITRVENDLSGDIWEEVYSDERAKIFTPRFETSLLWFVPKALAVKSVKEAIVPFASGESNVTEVCFLEELPNQFFGSVNDNSGTTEVLSRTPDRVRANVYAPTDGYALFADTFYDGWRAKVDGEPAKIAVANGMFRAVPIKAGNHEIEFSYSPKAFVIGAIITLLTLIIGTLLLVFLPKDTENSRADS